MFQTIDIKAYRGLKNITLQNLSRVNILVGENNTGKTSILEAIQLLRDPESGQCFVNCKKTST